MKDAAVSGVDRREPTGGDGEKKESGRVRLDDETKKRVREVDEKNNRAAEWSDRR